MGADFDISMNSSMMTDQLMSQNDETQTKEDIEPVFVHWRRRGGRKSKAQKLAEARKKVRKFIFDICSSGYRFILSLKD